MTSHWRGQCYFVLWIWGSLVSMKDSIFIRESLLPFWRWEKYHHFMTWCMNKQHINYCESLLQGTTVLEVGKKTHYIQLLSCQQTKMKEKWQYLKTDQVKCSAQMTYNTLLWIRTFFLQSSTYLLHFPVDIVPKHNKLEDLAGSHDQESSSVSMIQNWLMEW